MVDWSIRSLSQQNQRHVNQQVPQLMGVSNEVEAARFKQHLREATLLDQEAQDKAENTINLHKEHITKLEFILWRLQFWNNIQKVRQWDNRENNRQGKH